MEFTYFDIGGIDNTRNRIAETKSFLGRDAPSRARQAICKHDILFSTVRTYLRKIAIVDRDYPNPIASTGLTVIRAAEGVSPQLLFFQVLSEGFLQPLHTLQTGSSYPAVRDQDVFAQPIRLPPTLEQKRLAIKLGAALSGLDRGETASRRALQRLRNYPDTVLHAAVTGELTRKWRENNTASRVTKTENGKALLQRLSATRRSRWEETELRKLEKKGSALKKDKWKLHYPEPISPGPEVKAQSLPESWTRASLDQLSIVIRGASPRPAGDPRFFGGMIPWITVGSLTRDTRPYLTEAAETVTEAGKAASRFVESETLLLTNSGATLGVPKITRIAGCINDGVVALLNVDYPLKLYLYYALSAETKKLREINQGAAQPNLNTGIIRAIIVPLPPLDEQVQIIREVEHRLAKSEQLALAVNRQLDRASTTRDSLLREAFAGVLLPQDPDEEPASVLLDRVRAEQKATVDKLRLKPMPKTSVKGKTERRELLDVLRELKIPVTPEQLFREAGYEAAFVESETPQDIVDTFYNELRKLTNDRAKVAEDRSSPSRVLLRALS